MSERLQRGESALNSPDCIMKGGHEYITYDELHRRNCAFLHTPTGSSQSYPMVGIDFPGENDVMLGRGGGTTRTWETFASVS